jgi:hypothetical protein
LRCRRHPLNEAKRRIGQVLEPLPGGLRQLSTFPLQRDIARTAAAS